jgi:hypothetical protein
MLKFRPASLARARIQVLFVCAPLAASGIGWPVAGPAAGQRVSANSQTYSDPAGDSGPGPDITTSVVSNDDSGTLRFAITIANRPTLLSGEGLVVDLTTDTLTGCRSGGTGDYGIVFHAGDPPGIVRCDVRGGQFTLSIVTLRSFSGSYSSGQATFSVSRSELGITSGFSFDLATLTNVVVDRARYNPVRLPVPNRDRPPAASPAAAARAMRRSQGQEQESRGCESSHQESALPRRQGQIRQIEDD